MNFSHSDLVEIAEKWLLKRCGFAFTELSTHAQEIPDAIGFKSGISILIECKTSRADFLADGKKDFRKNPADGVGMYRFYLCPQGIIKPEELPNKWGLIYVDDKGQARKKKGPKGNVWSRSNGFIFQKRNVQNEMALMYSALRRLHLHGTFPLIYEYPEMRKTA